VDYDTPGTTPNNSPADTHGTSHSILNRQGTDVFMIAPFIDVNEPSQ
jgi:hypothetical protein